MSCRLARLVELGDGLLAAVAAPRVHDQVVPNATYVEHWRAGDASFVVPQQEIQVWKEVLSCLFCVAPWSVVHCTQITKNRAAAVGLDAKVVAEGCRL